MGTNPKSISIPFVVISPIFDCDVAKPEAEEAVAAVIKSFVFDIYADPSIVIIIEKSYTYISFFSSYKFWSDILSVGL
jgi:hypothetical protein